MSDEDLIRLEFKVDLIIQALQFSGVMLRSNQLPQLVGIEDPEEICPVCGDDVEIVLNFKNESIQRRCGCRLPKNIVPGISKLTQPPEVSDGYRSAKEEPVPPESEEGGPGDSGRQPTAGPSHRQ